MFDEIKKAIANRKVILFVGAGVSMNLGLPSWADLLKKMARDLDYDEKEFMSLGNYESLAEYYQLKIGKIGSLRSWMDREWHKPEIHIKDSEIHRLIVGMEFPIIYTTNYDRWIELAYDEFKGKRHYTKIVTVSDFAKVKAGKTQIVKFHGDFDYDDSIVLTESSYFERFDFETPLDIKLRADALGKSILFIGYSLRDVNIRYLLYKLSKLWVNTDKSRKPKSYILLGKPNPVEKTVLENWGIHSCISDKADLKEGLVDFLQKISPGK